MDTKVFFNKFSNEYEAQNRYTYLFYKWAVDTIVGQVNRPGKIVDIGTGNGELALRTAKVFPQASVIAADISLGMLKQARRRAQSDGLKNIVFIQKAAKQLAGVSADFFISNMTFHHLKDKRSVIENAFRSLEPRGKLVVGDWFKYGREYGELIDAIRKRNLRRATAFDESWRDFLCCASEGYYGSHPAEHPICPLVLRDMMKSAGFRKTKIVRCPLPFIAVVIAEQ